MPAHFDSPFVAHLEDLARREDRGALAALRRGLGELPGACADMHSYVVPFLGSGPWGWRRQCHYIVAALFGLHPEPGRAGNMGSTFRAVAEAEKERTRGEIPQSIERRFVALLKCHRDDLFDHLRQAVGLARSKDASVDWHRLLYDVERWDSDDRWVQRDWAESFWGNPAGQKTNQDSEEGADR